MRKSIIVACALLAFTPARADVITYTVNGIIGAQTGVYSSYWTGIDGSGLFGPPGASLVGEHFWVTWIATDCECIGAAGNPLIGGNYPQPNPILDVAIQVGTLPYGQNPTFDFPNLWDYGEFYVGTPYKAANFQQAGTLTGGGGIISTSFGSSVNPDAPNGAFRYGNTSGTFTRMAVGIPGPDMATGWLGFILALGALAWLARRRRAGQSSA